MTAPDLASTARALVAPAKGILAADESLPTIAKRFRAVNLPSTTGTRRAYREALFGAPGLGDYISGVILFDETIRQNTEEGGSLVALLQRQGILPGIKVDLGAHPLAGFPGETVTEGLDGLRDRLDGYARLGARFSKWRAVFTIGPETPGPTAVDANAHALARFAALSQEAGLVPVVEPEVLMDGDHPLARHEEVTTAVLRRTFEALAAHRVSLEGMLLKANMVLAGTLAPHPAAVQEVAAATHRMLRRVVPPAVPGIVFLSGGQGDVRATEHLNALNQLPAVPWQLSFSYGRALQAPALAAWGGHPANTIEMQRALLHRARCNSEARQGRYVGEHAPAGKDPSWN